MATTPPLNLVEEIERELKGELKELEDEARNRAVKRKTNKLSITKIRSDNLLSREKEYVR